MSSDLLNKLRRLAVISGIVAITAVPLAACEEAEDPEEMEEELEEQLDDPLDEEEDG